MSKSTYDKFYESLSAEEKKDFDNEYKDLLISEMLFAAMAQDDVSVRELAADAGVSPTIVQGLRSGTRKNVNMKTFFKILGSLGYTLSVERDGVRFSFDMNGIE